MRAFQVAHFGRTIGQDIAEQCLTFGRAGLSGPARPFQCGHKVRIGWGIGCEEPTSAAGITCGTAGLAKAAYAESGKQGLGFDEIVRGRSLQPPRSFVLAAWDPGTFEIGARNAILGLRNTSLCGTGKQRESFGAPLLLDKCDGPTQRSRRRSEAKQPINEHCHSRPFAGAAM